MLVVRRAKTKKPVVLTIGHSTHTWNDFRDLLRAHHVKRVVDVRSIPRSRHNPQFNRETLDSKTEKSDQFRIGSCSARHHLGALLQDLIFWMKEEMIEAVRRDLNRLKKARRAQRLTPHRFCALHTHARKNWHYRELRNASRRYTLRSSRLSTVRQCEAPRIPRALFD